MTARTFTQTNQQTAQIERKAETDPRHATHILSALTGALVAELGDEHTAELLKHSRRVVQRLNQRHRLTAVN